MRDVTDRLAKQLGVTEEEKKELSVHWQDKEQKKESLLRHLHLQGTHWSMFQETRRKLC